MIYSNSAVESALIQQGLLVWRGEIHLHFTTSPQGHSTTCLKEKIKIQPLHGITVLLKLITMHGHQNTIITKCTIEAMKRFYICSLWSHLNVLTFFPHNRGMLRRSRCALIFL